MRIEKTAFIKFLYNPSKLVEGTVKKVSMVGLSILTGVISLGILHAVFFPAYLKRRATRVPDPKHYSQPINQPIIKKLKGFQAGVPIRGKNQEFLPETIMTAIPDPVTAKFKIPFLEQIITLSPAFEFKDKIKPIKDVPILRMKISQVPFDLFIKKTEESRNQHPCYRIVQIAKLEKKEYYFLTTYTFTAQQINAMMQMKISPREGFHVSELNNQSRFKKFGLMIFEREKNHYVFNDQGNLQAIHLSKFRKKLK